MILLISDYVFENAVSLMFFYERHFTICNFKTAIHL